VKQGEKSEFGFSKSRATLVQTMVEQDFSEGLMQME
jgi:hypothetical protein